MTLSTLSFGYPSRMPSRYFAVASQPTGRFSQASTHRSLVGPTSTSTRCGPAVPPGEMLLPTTALESLTRLSDLEGEEALSRCQMTRVSTAVGPSIRWDASVSRQMSAWIPSPSSERLARTLVLWTPTSPGGRIAWKRSGQPLSPWKKHNRKQFGLPHNSRWYGWPFSIEARAIARQNNLYWYLYATSEHYAIRPTNRAHSDPSQPLSTASHEPSAM
jgi:hypothetical protein